MRRIAALLLTVTTLGCSTIQHGPMQSIAVDSQPQGAVIALDDCGRRGTRRATTPATVWVSRRSTRCQITLTVADREPRRIRLTRSAGDGVGDYLDGLTELCEPDGRNCNSLTDLFFVALVGAALALPSLAIDASTGAFFVQDPPRVFVDFDAADKIRFQ